MATVLLVTIWMLAPVSGAQSRAPRLKGANLHRDDPGKPLSREEKIIETAYAKLNFYNRAANAYQAAETKSDYRAERDIRFDIADIHTGPIEEIYGRKIKELMTPPFGSVINITTQARSIKQGPEHVLYRAEWAESSYKGSLLEDWDNTTFIDYFNLIGNSLKDVGKYTSYEVTVHLDGRERTYRAMILFHNQMESVERTRAEFADLIIGSDVLTHALAERRPAVKANWLNRAGRDASRSSLISPSFQGGLICQDGWCCEDDPFSCEPTSCYFGDCGPVPPPPPPPPDNLCEFYRAETGFSRQGQDDTEHPTGGVHQMQSSLRGICERTSTCQQRCTVVKDIFTAKDTGIPSICHKKSVQDRFLDGVDKCSGGVVAAFKGCLFCACSISIGVEIVGFKIEFSSSDALWLMEHTLNEYPCNPPG